MKTTLAKTIRIVLCTVITLTFTLSSCCCSQPRPYNGAQRVPMRAVGPARGPVNNHAGPMNAQQRRLDGAKGYMTITKHEALSPVEATPEAYRSIIANKRFIRDADGVISLAVFRMIASGGVIGWSGSDYRFENTVQEVTGVTDRISVDEAARACVKFKQLPPTTSGHGGLVRARALQIEAQRGYTLR